MRAHVTHFVTPDSLSDHEAQQRSTTVYMADRRYDMLPGVLSADLCSLVSGVDRWVTHGGTVGKSSLHIMAWYLDRMLYRRCM